MPNLEDAKSSIVEEEELIKELHALIKRKGLSVELTDKRPASVRTKLGELTANIPNIGPVSACPSCIACTCMICW